MAIPLAPSDGIVEDWTNHDQPPPHSPGFIANPKIVLLPALELKAVVASVCDMVYKVKSKLVVFLDPYNIDCYVRAWISKPK